jgi:DNA-binding transcriptional LysR family regulator
MVREILKTEERPAGVVRLAVPPAIAGLFVVPAVPRLREMFPEIILELAPATAVVDLVMREADLAIRTVRPDKGDLVVHRLAAVKSVVVCSPELAKRPLPLTELPWVAWDRSLSHIPEMVWLREHVADAAIVFRSTELSTLLRAAQEGIGALVVAEPVAARAGGLVRLVSHRAPMPESAVWLVSHRALRPVPRVAAVWQWVVDAFVGAPTLTSARRR